MGGRSDGRVFVRYSGDSGCDFCDLELTMAAGEMALTQQNEEKE